MKKIIIAIITIIITIALAYILYTTQDNIKFKKEYEKLNNKKDYLTIEIPKDNNIKYIDANETIELLENGTGIIYFGFPECPWCRNAIPVLIDAAKKQEIENIYYFNAKPIRDEKELKDGKIITTKEGTEEYYQIVNKLSDYLGPYEGLEDENIKRLYFPTAVFLMGGKVVGIHIGTVESQTDPTKSLTKKQTKELQDIYTKNIKKIYGTCDTETSC